MFTGLVEELGKITNIKTNSTGKEFTIIANKIFSDLKLGDSIAINGVCQTVTNINKNSFSFIAVNETLKKTTLNYFINGQIVNLERALTLNSRLGGHIVQGHIDAYGRIIQINKRVNNIEIYISFDSKYKKFLVNTGSICIDGISLTTAEIFDYSFKVSIIPTTLNNTIVKNYKVNDIVNLEFDIIGKYICNMLNNREDNNINNFSKL